MYVYMYIMYKSLWYLLYVLLCRRAWTWDCLFLSQTYKFSMIFYSPLLFLFFGKILTCKVQVIWSMLHSLWKLKSNSFDPKFINISSVHW